MASGRGGTQRVLAKLEASIRDEKYYEAHQMYRTLYFRYNAQKKYAEAIDLLYTGATKLLEVNQHGSGSDLALLLIEVLQGSDAEVSTDIISTAECIIQKRHKCMIQKVISGITEMDSSVNVST